MRYVNIGDLPPYLYKYRSLAGPRTREFVRDIIVGNRLYWPSPSDFNDPFDCAPVHEMRGSKLKRELKIKRIVRKGMPFASKAERAAIVTDALRRPDELVSGLMDTMQRNMLQKVGVCSLSTNPSSVLMWSHYSDSHRGICLRFKFSASSDLEFVSESDLHFEFALPVTYSEERPVISILDEIRDQNVLERALLTKAKYWDYEDEWRMINHREGPGAKAFPPACLDAIVFGAQISGLDRELVTSWNDERESPADLLQACFDKRLFKLNLEDAH